MESVRNDILDKAKTIINGERQGTYGKAEDNFKVIAEFWSAYLGKKVSSDDVANMMILMKVARNSSGVYKDDNWIDICGYAALGGEIQSQSSETRAYNMLKETKGNVVDVLEFIEQGVSECQTK